MEEKTFVEDIDRSLYDFRNEDKDAYRIEEGLTKDIVENFRETNLTLSPRGELERSLGFPREAHFVRIADGRKALGIEGDPTRPPLRGGEC